MLAVVRGTPRVRDRAVLMAVPIGGCEAREFVEERQGATTIILKGELRDGHRMQFLARVAEHPLGRGIGDARRDQAVSCSMYACLARVALIFSRS